MTETLNVYKGTKKDFLWLNVSIPGEVWLIFSAAGPKLSEGRYLLITPFGYWKLMMEAAS